jgi:hypothetical protein
MALALTNEPMSLSDDILLADVQTTSARINLVNFGVGEEKAVLDPSRMSECAVAHEVKEFGQHVLACTVVYSASPHSHLPKTNHPI